MINISEREGRRRGIEVGDLYTLPCFYPLTCKGALDQECTQLGENVMSPYLRSNEWDELIPYLMSRNVTHCLPYALVQWCSLILPLLPHTQRSRTITQQVHVFTQMLDQLPFLTLSALSALDQCHPSIQFAHPHPGVGGPYLSAIPLTLLVPSIQTILPICNYPPARMNRA